MLQVFTRQRAECFEIEVVRVNNSQAAGNIVNRHLVIGQTFWLKFGPPGEAWPLASYCLSTQSVNNMYPKDSSLHLLWYSVLLSQFVADRDCAKYLTPDKHDITVWIVDEVLQNRGKG